ncbi:MAG TPA: glycosyltransferase family 2 protein [Terracidiphilus sp.]|jgi:4,4'-diaponeurosporenoate glycosyltransferase|nr:glycosyltransferase family 2 protein [Terracidiphilus sp.]
MILPAALCALGLAAGFFLIWRIPTCPAAEPFSGANFSIIIPARNEEQNLPRLLESIFQSATLPADVLVVDDGSTDDSAAVADSLGARVLTSAAKPAGWTGKSWACHQGAQNTAGDLLLFLDADTYFLPGGLDRLISRWSRERDRRVVLSVLPYHAMSGAYEQLSLFFNILMAAGAGGFGAVATPRLFGQSLLISRSVYIEAGGHAAVRGVVLENLRWASTLSEHGARLLCLGGRGVLHMRMFPEGFRQMSESWTKATLQGASDSGRMILVAAIVWISSLWSTLLLLIMPYDYGRPGLFFVYLLFALQILWFARQLGNYLAFACVCFPLTLAYYCAVVGRAAARRTLGRKTIWRGREV